MAGATVNSQGEQERDEEAEALRRGNAAKDRLAGIVTILALAAFAAFVAYLLVDISASEVAWSRRVYLFAAVEAVAFAAVGWLFGREVHRERADTAEKNAAEADKKATAEAGRAAKSAEEAIKHRERGYALKDAISAARQAHQQLPPHLEQLGVAGERLATATRTQLDQLARQAELLYPDSERKR